MEAPASSVAHLTPLERKIVAALEESDKPLPAMEIAKALGSSIPSVQNSISRLRRHLCNGKRILTSYGQGYFLADDEI